MTLYGESREVIDGYLGTIAGATPAQLTRPVSRPKRLTARSIAALPLSASVTSVSANTVMPTSSGAPTAAHSPPDSGVPRYQL